ncbi:hypothetical protein GCM10029978_118470 [Actinoallomurus acanthiterrae]
MRASAVAPERRKPSLMPTPWPPSQRAPRACLKPLTAPEAAQDISEGTRAALRPGKASGVPAPGGDEDAF